MMDFTENPIWVSCHSVDYNEPWYKDADEETYRPYSGLLPVAADEMYLVASILTLADGSCFPGFATPSSDEDSMGIMQPYIFAPDGSADSFWLGMSPDPGSIDRLYSSLGRRASAVFPIQFSAQPGLTSAFSSGVIPGFMMMKEDGSVEVLK